MRKTAKKPVKFTQEARKRDPASMPFYSSRKPQIQVVSTGFNALKISDRQRFTLKAYGKPFNYQGVITKRYDLAALSKIFFTSYFTLYQWIKKGYLPEPQITMHRKRIWMYHQIQPFYVWYWHQRNKKRTLAGLTEADYKILVRMQRYADMRWHRLLGVEYPDPYREKAGKFGVIWQ